MNLKEFKTIKSPLLKEWSKDFEVSFSAALYNLKCNFNKNIIYENGAKLLSPSDSLFNYMHKELEKLFGLPYVSGGEFAGLWNTNTQAKSRWGVSLWFRCVARAENDDFVFIFEDKKENFYYFYKYDFLRYQEHERKKQAAKEWGEFLNICEKIQEKTRQVLAKYEGKPYGDKTRQKIAEEIQAAAKEQGATAWLSSYYEYLEINKNNFKRCLYLTFLNNDGKIKIPELVKIEHCDTLKEFEKAKKLEPKIKQKAAELLALVKEYNEHTSKINQRPETTTTYSLDLDRLASGTFEK